MAKCPACGGTGKKGDGICTQCNGTGGTGGSSGGGGSRGGNQEKR